MRGEKTTTKEDNSKALPSRPAQVMTAGGFPLDLHRSALSALAEHLQPPSSSSCLPFDGETVPQHHPMRHPYFPSLTVIQDYIFVPHDRRPFSRRLRMTRRPRNSPSALPPGLTHHPPNILLSMSYWWKSGTDLRKKKRATPSQAYSSRGGGRRGLPALTTNRQ